MQTRKFHEISRFVKGLTAPNLIQIVALILGPVVIPVVCLFDPGPSREDEGRLFAISNVEHSCE